MYRFAGNRGLAAGDESGDEQPLEAVALLEAHVAAKAVTGEAMHAASANRCLAWFLGENVLATPSRRLLVARPVLRPHASTRPGAG